MSKFHSNSSESSLDEYHLQSINKIKPIVAENVGTARMVDKDNFPILNGVTCYSVEIWEDCMRLPHWHPNATEIGYVISGSIEIMIWRSPGESAVFTLGPGMCWFIPQAALHSLNNIGKERAMLLVGFSHENPQDIDLPVAFNGIPAPIRDAYTSPHSDLRKWKGIISNPLVGHYEFPAAINTVRTASPYGFDFAKVTPLFSDPALGSVTWGVKDNWGILENISLLRACLKPNVARDPIWYPDAGTLYVVARGNAQFHLIMADHEPRPFSVAYLDYIFVPPGVLHTFMNTSKDEVEMIAFFTQANPKPEVSLAISTAFFPNIMRKTAMTEYGTKQSSTEDPLKNLREKKMNPYLLKI